MHGTFTLCYPLIWMSDIFRICFRIFTDFPTSVSLLTSQGRSYQLGHKTIGSVQSDILFRCYKVADMVVVVVVVVVVVPISDKIYQHFEFHFPQHNFSFFSVCDSLLYLCIL